MELWQTVTAISTGVMALAVIITLLLAVRQLRALREARYLQASIEIHRDFGDLWKERQFVMNELPDIVKKCNSLDEIPQPEREKAFKVMTFFERVGALLYHRLINEDLVLDLISWSAINCWKGCEWYIVLIRKKQDDPKLYENFEFLQKACKEWLAKHPSKLPKKI